MSTGSLHATGAAVLSLCISLSGHFEPKKVHNLFLQVAGHLIRIFKCSGRIISFFNATLNPAVGSSIGIDTNCFAGKSSLVKQFIEVEKWLHIFPLLVYSILCATFRTTFWTPITPPSNQLMQKALYIRVLNMTATLLIQLVRLAFL